MVRLIPKTNEREKLCVALNECIARMCDNFPRLHNYMGEKRHDGRMKSQKENRRHPQKDAVLCVIYRFFDFAAFDKNKHRE